MFVSATAGTAQNILLSETRQFTDSYSDLQEVNPEFFLSERLQFWTEPPRFCPELRLLERQVIKGRKRTNHSSLLMTSSVRLHTLRRLCFWFCSGSHFGS